MLIPPYLTYEFQWAISAHGYATRPSAAMGIAVTPGSNTKGAFATLISGANLLYDVYGILIHINSGATSAAIRSMLVDIGIDPSGGTTYSVVIPDLVGSAAASSIVQGGIWYYFPLYIKAGSSIGARASVNNTTVGTVRVNVVVYGSPSRPELCKTGQRVTAYGVVPTTSTGTSVTPGTTADGTWVQLAATIAERNWWWQLGVSVSNSTITSVGYAADLSVGDAINKDIIIQDALWWGDTVENWANNPVSVISGEANIPSGVNIYGRLQASSTAITGLSMIAYGLGD